jgi:16S rRNA C967 or C1407 C5-methylase (RsmB/RsmF family)
VTEVQIEKEASKKIKHELSEEKRTKLLAAMAKEAAAAIGPEALKLRVTALAAAAEARQFESDKKKRAKFEKEGIVFKFKVPLEAPQSHFVYYIENETACLALIDGKMLSSSEKVLDKGGKKKRRAPTDRTCPPYPLAGHWLRVVCLVSRASSLSRWATRCAPSW